jgi:hypothetical protein
MRDDFSKSIIETLSKRVGSRCSNPGCRQVTAGPSEEPTRSVNIGVAAHITAAAEGGPRYERSLSNEKRQSIENGIWLCQNCGKLIDNDPARYTVELLKRWKVLAEETTRVEIEGAATGQESKRGADLILDWRKIEIRSERHEYSLALSVHNVGTEILRNYHVDLEMPSPVLLDSSGVISSRSDDNKSLFRMNWRTADDDIYPDDRKTVIIVSYYMSSSLYWDEDVLESPVRATLYHEGQREVVIEKRFREIQCF